MANGDTRRYSAVLGEFRPPFLNGASHLRQVLVSLDRDPGEPDVVDYLVKFKGGARRKVRRAPSLCDARVLYVSMCSRATMLYIACW